MPEIIIDDLIVRAILINDNKKLSVTLLEGDCTITFTNRIGVTHSESLVLNEAKSFEVGSYVSFNFNCATAMCKLFYELSS